MSTILHDSDGRPKRPLSSYFKFKAALIAEFKAKGEALPQNLIKERWDQMTTN